MTSTTLLYSIPSCQYVHTFNSKPCSVRKGDRPRTIPTTIRALNLFDESGTGLRMRKRDNEIKDRGEDMCVCVYVCEWECVCVCVCVCVCDRQKKRYVIIHTRRERGKEGMTV